MSQRPGTVPGDVRRRPETKSFILTSEFWVAAGAVVAVFLGGYALDDIARTTAWRYGTWIAIAYVISRGIAKAGSQRSYQADPRDDRADVDFWGERPEAPVTRGAPDHAVAGARRTESDVEAADRPTRPPPDTP